MPLLAMVCALALTLVACSDGPDRGNQARVRADGRILVPDHVPDGFALREVNEHGVAPRDAFVRLYGAPGAANPLAGRWIALIYQGGTRTGASLGASPVRAPEIRRSGDYVSYAWELPSDSEDEAEAAVTARGLSDKEVLALAARTRADRATASVKPLDPPAGMAELASGRVSIGALNAPHSNWPYPSARLLWQSTDGFLAITAVAHDDALALLLRSTVADAGTRIRGHNGARGPRVLAPGPRQQEAALWTWTEDGLDLMVHARGIDAAEMERVIASLRPSTVRDWNALRTAAASPPAEADARDTKVFAGSFSDGSWSVRVQRTGASTFLVRDEVRYVDGSPGSGSAFAGPVGDRPMVNGVMTRAGLLVHGHAPRSVARLEVIVSTGDRVTPAIELGGRDWEAGFFAVWFPKSGTITEATGYDSTGALRFRGRPEPAMVFNPGGGGGFLLAPV